MTSHAEQSYGEPYAELLLATSGRASRVGIPATLVSLLDDEAGCARFIELSGRHGVQGLALTALQRSRALEGRRAAEPLRALLSGLRRRAAILQLERDKVVAALRLASIDAVVLKGAGLATTVYDTPVERDFGDVDLLLRPEHIDAAARTLEEHGYRAASDVISAGYREHHFHLRLERPNGMIVELHWALTRSREAFRLDAGTFLEQSVVRDGERHIRVPRPEHSLLHIVVENVRGGFSRLTRLVDVDRIVSASPRLDWDYLRASARDSHLQPALAISLALSRAMLATEVPQEVMRQLRPRPMVRVALELLRPAESLLGQRSLTRPSWGTLMQLWLLSGRSRLMTLAEGLSSAGDDPLQWLWMGEEVPTSPGGGMRRRLLRVAKVVAFQLSVIGAGLADLPPVRARPMRDRRTGLWG